MPIDASIISGLKPVQFDPSNAVNLLQRGIAQRQQTQLHQQQVQLNDQRIEEGKAAVQKSQVAARDQQITQQAFLKSKGDPKATAQFAIEMGASSDAITSLQKHDADLQEKYAKIEADKLPVRKYRNEQMLGLHQQAIDLATSDPQAYQQAWPQFYSNAVKTDPEAAKHLDPNTPATVDQLKLSQVGYATDAFYLKQAEEKRAQDAAKRAQSGEERAAALGVPQLEKATAEAASANRQQDASVLANAAKQGPDALAAALQRLSETSPDRVAPFMRVTASSKPEDILAIGETPHEQITTGLTKERNAQVAKNEERMRSIAEGNLAVSREHADIAKQIYEQTYGSGANPALQGVEPKLRTQAATAAQKAADEYTKAMESSANVQTFIDMARKGNKAAGSNLPIMGAESLQALNGIKRINKTEIDQYSGAGSLLDKIQGRIGKLTSGQPIPADVMSDIEALHKAISGNASTNYNTKLSGINQNYRSNFQPVKGTAAPGKTATMDQVRAYASAHGISEAEAKKAAEADGFTVK